MIDQNKNFLSILAFCFQILFFIALCSIESIFFSPRSSFLEIDLWIISLVFMGLHRNILTGLIFAIATSFFMTSFSGIPYYSTIISFLCIIIFLHIIKSRSFAPGPSYFSICSFFAILIFYSTYFALSWILGDTPIRQPHILQWVISALTSSALFVFIRPFLISIDSACRFQYPFGFEVKT